MAWGNLRRDEQIGLALALVLHAALLSLFLLRPAIMPAPVPQPINVTLSQDTGLNAAAPTQADAAADLAPTLGAPPPLASSSAPVPPATPAPAASPPPAKVETPSAEEIAAEPTPAAVTQPRRVELKRPRPEAMTSPEPVAAPPPAKAPPRHRLKAQETAGDAVADAAMPAKTAHKHVASARTAPSVKDWNLAAPAPPDHQPAGGSRIGNDFLKGIAGGKASGKAQTQGAAVIGPEVKSSLSGAIARQLKPHWEAPQGVDADKLVTVLSWDLNPDGSLAATPRVVRQEGITDSNRPQAPRHAEQAIRAVELGAPFKLPAEYYAVWKHVRSFEFNRTLSQ